LDNSYFNVALAPTGSASSHLSGADVATFPNTLVDGINQGSLTVGQQAQNSYVSNLKDPGAYAKANITIMGDPDFLIQDSPSSVNALYSKFYGTDSYTINANGGQVFIEISFNEGVDYKNSDGLMSVNESILFWEYPEAIIKSGLKGVSYKVNTVKSTFSKGLFTQDLECNINSFPNAADAEKQVNQSSINRNPNAAGSIGAAAAASPSTITAADLSKLAAQATAPVASVAATTGTQLTAFPGPGRTGPITANDDAASTAAYSKTKDAILSAANGGREGLTTVPLNNAGGIIIGNINPKTLLPIR